MTEAEHLRRRVADLEAVLLPFEALARHMALNPDAQARPDSQELEVVYAETGEGDLVLGDFRRLLQPRLADEA